MFRQMQEDGFSHASALAFADLAEANNDPDAAIAALEHSLLQNGENPDLHARLADLYARIGNDGMAQHHGSHAGAAPDAPERQIWGRVGVGIAYDTNPTSAENSAQIRLFDVPSNAFINVAARDEEPDTLATVSLELNGDYKLSETALLAAELNVSAEKYFDVEELDTITASFTTGPWLGLGEAENGPVWLRPYLALNAATLDGRSYYYSYGAGAELRYSLNDTDQASLTATVLRTDYNGQVSANFDANTLDSTALLLNAGLFGEAAFDSTYAVQVSGAVLEASSSSESYLLVGLEAGLNVPITGFGQATGIPLSVQVGGSVNHFRYANEDPDVDPTQARRDLWLGGNGSLLLTVTEDVDLTIGVDYVRQFSNIDAFDTDNLRIFTELGLSF